MNLRIQEHRKRAGYSSARAFAEDHGYNVKTYTNWEQSAAMPPLEKAWELADIFGCAIDDLVGRESPSAGISISEDERRVLSERPVELSWNPLSGPKGRGLGKFG